MFGSLLAFPMLPSQCRVVPSSVITDNKVLNCLHFHVFECFLLAVFIIFKFKSLNDTAFIAIRTWRLNLILVELLGIVMSAMLYNVI